MCVPTTEAKERKEKVGRRGKLNDLIFSATFEKVDDENSAGKN